MDRIVTCIAPVNIAVIKYWGKRDEELIVPLNDSISVTLSHEEMCAKTTVIVSPRFTKDRFWLNWQEESLDNPRITKCLKEVRRRAGKRKEKNGDTSFLQWHVHICSINNFPTAAGLASSAAGFACLVFALAKVFEIEGDLSVIARLGSGSACRSLYGGLVRWFKGSLDDGSDSFAHQISFPEAWDNLHVIICVASDKRKKVGSTEGMRRCVATSPLMKSRIEETVIQRIESMLKAIDEANWSSFCDLTMTDSNEMHAICLSSFPPSIYMNDTGHSIAALVHSYNELKTAANKLEEKVCYTFDAGPNSCLFVRGKSFSDFASILNACFPQDASYNHPDDMYWKGLPTEVSPPHRTFSKLINEHLQQRHSVRYFIHTRVGDGPRVLDASHHLLSETTGLPKGDNDPNVTRSSVIRSPHLRYPSPGDGTRM